MVKGINRAFTEVKLKESKIFEKALFLHRINGESRSEGEILGEANRIISVLGKEIYGKAEKKEKRKKILKGVLFLALSFLCGFVLSTLLWLIFM